MCPQGETLARRARPESAPPLPVDARGGGATAVRSRLPRGDARRPPTQMRTPAGPAGRQRAGRARPEPAGRGHPGLEWAQWDRLLERRFAFSPALPAHGLVLSRWHPARGGGAPAGRRPIRSPGRWVCKSPRRTARGTRARESFLHGGILLLHPCGPPSAQDPGLPGT
ncbi:transmembrane protein 80 isoform X4 [Eubalaena glacialis]|uniref:transmembrane protein 80 isoform X4 n=1 Tax=Eubalaena glacialis TaxID=27606 RepID=UPI002A59E3BD|nr:transmembrane protein 80 isoform X4 [Eubalaena glacialis]